LGPYFKLDIHEAELEDGDQILLITDGVNKVFHPLEAAQVVRESGEIVKGASELVRLSRLRGSPDDITVMVVEWEEED
jgi:serine/threonine protein phosphatase PrpC